VFSFIGFSLGRAWQGFWRNAVMSIAATATMILMLLLLSSFYVVLTGLNAGLEFVESKVEIVADLRPDATSAQVDALRAQVTGLPEVATVEYVDATEALRRFRERLAAQGREDLTGFLDANPLPASLEVKLKDPKVFGTVVEVLRGRTDVVHRVLEIQSLVDRVLTITNLLRTGGVAVLGLVGLTVLFIIINTIRLAVVARSEEIEIMRLVGASDAFIRWPFIFEGALVGLLGAGATLVLLALGAEPLGRVMTGFFDVLPLQLGSLARDLVVLVLGTGVGLGVLGSYVSVRSYLLK
jgi:cell division transport system permease protein